MPLLPTSQGVEFPHPEMLAAVLTSQLLILHLPISTFQAACGLLLLECVSAIDGLGTRRCCGMAFTPCGRLLLLGGTALLFTPLVPLDHGRGEYIGGLVVMGAAVVLHLEETCPSVDTPGCSAGTFLNAVLQMCLLLCSADGGKSPAELMSQETT